MRNFFNKAFSSHQSSLLLISLFIVFWRYGGHHNQSLIQCVLQQFLLTIIMQRHCTGQRVRNVCGKGLSEKCSGITLLRVYLLGLFWFLSVQAEPGSRWIIQACSQQRRAQTLLTEPVPRTCEFGFKGDLFGFLYELSKKKCDRGRHIEAILLSK